MDNKQNLYDHQYHKGKKDVLTKFSNIIIFYYPLIKLNFIDSLATPFFDGISNKLMILNFVVKLKNICCMDKISLNH